MDAIKKIFFIILLLSINNYSQSLSIGLGSGISIVQGNNYFTNNLGPAGLYYVNGAESEFKGLDFRNEYDFAVNIKYGFKYVPFSLVAQIHYLPLRGIQSVNIYDDLLKQNILNDVTTEIDIWSLKIGARYATIIQKVKPYLTASILLNYFGDTWFKFEHDNNISKWRNYKNGMRYGLNLGFGFGYEVINNIDLDIEANYNFMNLWNRRGTNPIDKIHPSVEERMNTLNIELGVYYRML